MDTIRVLGAGVAGLTTALLLARRSRAVEVRDRSWQAGGRFGGGFQALDNHTRGEDVLDEMRGMGLEPDCEMVPLRSALLLDQDMRRYEVASERPYAYLLRRGSDPGTLDAWLRQACAEAGVQAGQGEADDDWVPDVVATGPWRADGVAREVVFRSEHPDLIVVLFDPFLTPSGYSYLYVQDGRGTIGAAQVRRLGSLRRNARAACRKLLDAFPVPMTDEREQVLHMNFALPRHLCHGGRWYVGEAAGVQDYLFGIGNRLAVRSASLAARAVTGEAWDAAGFERDILRPMQVSILGRCGFELAGPRMTTRMCRYLASGDFRERLIALQRPARWRLAVARLVMAAWRDPAGCRRLPVARWCRRRRA